MRVHRSTLSLRPARFVEAAKNLLQRLRTYDDAPYMEEMSNMLDLVNDGTENTEIISGNMKLKIAVIGTNCGGSMVVHGKWH